MDRQTRLFAQQAIEPAEQGAPTRQNETPIDQVGRQFRRATLEGNANGVDDRRDRLEQGFAHFLGSNRERLGQARDLIATPLDSARLLPRACQDSRC